MRVEPALLRPPVVHDRQREPRQLDLGGGGQGLPYAVVVGIAVNGHEGLAESAQQRERGHVGQITGVDHQIAPCDHVDARLRERRSPAGEVRVAEDRDPHPSPASGSWSGGRPSARRVSPRMIRK